MDDQQFRQLLQYLGLSWKGYRKVRKGVIKRIHRHMHQLGCQSVGAYLHELEKSHQTRVECERFMTVSISRLFRDRKLWGILQKEILPCLVQKHRQKMSVWSAGCASGEEVYSLKILWDDLNASLPNLPDLEITATDLNPVYLERARTGIYPSSSLKEIPEQFRSAYFHRKKSMGCYEIKHSLKKGIVWQTQHLLSCPTGSQFHIIFLRNNLLTYYQDRLKISAFNKVINQLSVDGFLIIGSHERLPSEKKGLLPYGSLSYVFQKRG
jgi:chemotaxis protein methyltransferase CheR